MHRALAVVDDPLFMQHRAPADHPERPARVTAARRGLEEAALGGERRTLAGRDASDDELRRVHTREHLDLLERTAGTSGHYDPDTYYGPRSTAAARRAAGGAIALADALLDGLASTGVGLLRPPGHHATPSRAMGFCLLNNIAVAASHGRARGLDRVLIFDWDVHHGNGTQEIFWTDPSVLYVSLHQYPFYPGSGTVEEVGSGDGRGYTVNIPLSAGADDAAYEAAMDRIVGPIAHEFDPDLVLVSAGFDGHARDPLGGMDLSELGYAAMIAKLRSALPRGLAGRCAILLEGGYDATALTESLRATLEILEGSGAPRESGQGPGRVHERDLERAAAAQRPFWQLG